MSGINTDDLTTLHRARPFRQFRIRVADGRTVDVHQPHFLARSPSGRSAVVYKPDDTWEVLDVPLIASLEILNGASSRKRRK